MAEAVKHRFFNIKTATHGATSVTTIQSVDFDADVQEIADSGDDDAVDTFLMPGKTTVRGTITLKDPVQAAALLGATAADFVFKGSPQSGGVDVIVTLKNLTFFGLAPRAMHNGVWMQTLRFRLYNPTGGAQFTMALAP
jgi:hypothetical protein